MRNLFLREKNLIIENEAVCIARLLKDIELRKDKGAIYEDHQDRPRRNLQKLRAPSNHFELQSPSQRLVLLFSDPSLCH